MVCLSSSNCRISDYFDNIRLQLSTHAYSKVLLHSIGQNIQILKIYFYDIITNEL